MWLTKTHAHTKATLLRYKVYISHASVFLFHSLAHILLPGILAKHQQKWHRRQMSPQLSRSDEWLVNPPSGCNQMHLTFLVSLWSKLPSVHSSTRNCLIQRKTLGLFMTLPFKCILKLLTWRCFSIRMDFCDHHISLKLKYSKEGNIYKEKRKKVGSRINSKLIIPCHQMLCQTLLHHHWSEQ